MTAGCPFGIETSKDTSIGMYFLFFLIYESSYRSSAKLLVFQTPPDISNLTSLFSQGLLD